PADYKSAALPVELRQRGDGRLRTIEASSPTGNGGRSRFSRIGREVAPELRASAHSHPLSGWGAGVGRRSGRLPRGPVPPAELEEDDRGRGRDVERRNLAHHGDSHPMVERLDHALAKAG